MQTGQEGHEPRPGDKRPGDKDEDAAGTEDTTAPHGTGGTAHKPAVKYTPRRPGGQEGGDGGDHPEKVGP